jgi:hypothetical protein
MSELPIRVVCATRQKKEDFEKKTATGRSLFLSQHISPHQLALFAENQLGLGALYSAVIKHAQTNPAVLVFMHDDLYINDFFWAHRIRQGLQKFDIVGLAGNIRRVPGQPAWAFTDLSLKWDEQHNLSGVVAHGSLGEEKPPRPFGSPNQKCSLLDGVLLAASSETLNSHQVNFDPQFQFHFYDMDFCRQAHLRNLSMGTIALSTTHQSSGKFGTAVWQESYRKYIKKWGD